MKVAQSLVTPWTIQSMEFSGPEYWSGYHSLLQGILTTHRSNSGLPQVDSLPVEPPENGVYFGSEGSWRGLPKTGELSHYTEAGTFRQDISSCKKSHFNYEWQELNSAKVISREILAMFFFL